jgi:hypothetical protein
VETDFFNCTVVIRKVEIEVTVEKGMTPMGLAGSVTTWVDTTVLIELVNMRGRAVTVFVSSTICVTVRIGGTVAADDGYGELPSTATTE